MTEIEFLTEVSYSEKPAARFPLLDQMFVERGTKDDWELLHELHYKAAKLPAGPHYWKLTLEGRTIGVLVVTSPKGLLKERHIAFPNLKPGGEETKITNTYRYAWINGNLRVISRFVIDTMFRGIGAGYRFQNLASRLEQRRFIEIQSSMSKFNTFGQKAGFQFVKPMNSARFEKGLVFFRQHLASNPADIEEIMTEFAAMPAGLAAATEAAMRDFYLKNSAQERTGKGRHGRGEARVERMSLRELMVSLQQLVLASPMYGVWENPDLGRALPERLPLSAFDRQRPSEPLRL